MPGRAINSRLSEKLLGTWWLYEPDQGVAAVFKLLSTHSNGAVGVHAFYPWNPTGAPGQVRAITSLNNLTVEVFISLRREGKIRCIGKLDDS